jgi:hypothetical protein
MAVWATDRREQGAHVKPMVEEAKREGPHPMLAGMDTAAQRFDYRASDDLRAGPTPPAPRLSGLQAGR